MPHEYAKPKGFSSLALSPCCTSPQPSFGCAVGWAPLLRPPRALSSCCCHSPGSCGGGGGFLLACGRCRVRRECCRLSECAGRSSAPDARPCASEVWGGTSCWGNEAQCEPQAVSPGGITLRRAGDGDDRC